MGTGGRRTIRALTLAALVCVAATAGSCPADGGPASSGRVPPPPSTPTQSLGADSPPVVWLGGTIVEARADRIRLQQGDGSIAALQRLPGSATKVFEIAGDAWAPVAPGARVDGGKPACIETLMDGTNLVAIRVFLGAGCGPI